jgi:diguanylate cyclase (GGDEF)-like protein
LSLTDRIRRITALIIPLSPKIGDNGDSVRSSYNDPETSDSGFNDDAQARLRAQQLLTVSRLTPLNSIANFLDVGLTLAIFWNDTNRAALLGWALMQALIWGFALYNWYSIISRPQPPQRASTRAISRSNLHAAILALLWALPPALLYQGSTAEQQLFLTTITAGMMCAGGFALYTVPNASLTFVGILGTASVFALLSSNVTTAHYLILLLIIYLAILAISILHAAAVFRAHVLADIASERQNQVISLLLNDFEQSTADVLWETTHDLRLHRTTARFAELFGELPGAINHMQLPYLIRQNQLALPEELQEIASQQFLLLEKSLASAKAFRDLEIPLHIKRQIHWWSLTAKPAQEGGWRGVIADITHAHQANQRIWQLAHEDSVTGLANRHWFQAELESALRSSVQDQQQHALLCIDLDRFKAVNDTFGHDTGDLLLKVVAERLRHHTRSQDLVARTGGDEFAIILREIQDQRQIEDIARRLLMSLQQTCQLQGANVSVGASIGIACIPADGVFSEVVMKHADLALYQAKAGGRGRFVRFVPAMAERAHNRHKIEQALRQTLEERKLSLMFQPQRHLRSGHLTGVEALARWTDHNLGIIAPALFIEVAEESGLIHDLGKQILESACQYLSSWESDITLSVNISPLQLVHPDIVALISNTLTRYRIKPGRLELEITENVLLDDTHGTLQKLRQIRDMGVRIALDDFGTGYSSLAYLRRFPFDKIKIDQSFVREMVQEASACTIVGAIIDMAGALNMEVVAEGVENEESLRLLQQLGCDMAQGYHIFPPMTPQDFARSLVRPVA